MQHGTYGNTRTRATRQEKQRRQAIMEEFFQAYHAARYANGVFTETPSYRSGSNLWRTSPSAPECLATLGLSWPCTGRDVKQAFRTRVKRVHPDIGGSSEAFQTLHQAYKAALALVA